MICTNQIDPRAFALKSRLPNVLSLLSELLSSLPVIILPLAQINQILPEEQRHVDQRSDGSAAADHAAPQNCGKKVHAVDKRQPLGLDGHDVEHEELRIGIQRCKGEEEREVEVRISPNGVACDEVGNERAQDIGQCADHIVNKEAANAPAVFQRCANRVVKVHADERPQRARAAGRHDQPGDQAPDFSAQHFADVQRHVADDADGAQGIGAGHGSKQIQQENARHGENNITHERGNIVAVQLAFELIQKIAHVCLR